MAELTLPLDRDCQVAAILAGGTSGTGALPSVLVHRYYEILIEIQKQKGTFGLWERAQKAALSR